MKRRFGSTEYNLALANGKLTWLADELGGNPQNFVTNPSDNPADVNSLLPGSLTIVPLKEPVS